MGRVIHFELNAENPERAAGFYKKVFGWRIEKWSGPNDYWLITTGDKQEAGIDGGLMKRSSPGMTTVNTIEVKSVDEIVKKVEDAGGKTAAPKMAVPGIGYLAYLIDTEGIVFGVMETDPQAK